jgi:hypothetical protein
MPAERSSIAACVCRSLRWHRDRQPGRHSAAGCGHHNCRAALPAVSFFWRLSDAGTWCPWTGPRWPSCLPHCKEDWEAALTSFAENCGRGRCGGESMPSVHIRTYNLSGDLSGAPTDTRQKRGLRKSGSRRLQRYSSETVLCFLSTDQLRARNTRPVKVELNSHKQAIFLRQGVIKYLLAHYCHKN